MTSVADIFSTFVDDGSTTAFRAYDGSAVGPSDAAAVVEVRSPLAMRYLVSAPGELGLARAYVTGLLDVTGDLHAALLGLATNLRAARRSDVVRLLAAVGWRPFTRPAVPPEEAPPRWKRGLIAHTKRRDAVAIAHHYDLSNSFYRLLLGPSMAYSCAVFTAPDRTLEEAQAEKFDLVCRKLDLQPGQRLLDVGAGWGGMVMHAAANYGVRAVGVTLSRRQAEWAERAIADRGLGGRAAVSVLDYRDVDREEFDAISSIGAMEHFGSRRLGSHFASMAARLRPEGRMLNHCITRPSNRDRHRVGPFIDRYVFPDGELEGPGTVLSAMHDHGFEVRHAENLREHYAITLRRWADNLERRWPEAVGEIGERRARAWRLYIAASRVGFELNRLQIHQMLGVHYRSNGHSGMPLRPDWEHRRAHIDHGARRHEAHSIA